jgi:hypothetical protein
MAHPSRQKAWRTPTQLALAKRRAELLVEAVLLGGPFCPERLRLTRLLRFRLCQDHAEVACLINKAIDEACPEAQDEIVRLLTTLLHDIGQ